MRYIVATVVASLILGAFVVNHWWVATKLDRVAKQVERQAGLPPGTGLNNFGVPVSGSLMLAIKIDHLFIGLWLVVVPLVLLLTFGVAALTPRR